MSGKEAILEIIRDGEIHTLEEIESLARLRCGERVTVHSRIADLRREGWMIDGIREGRKQAYRLTGRKDHPVRVKEKRVDPVQGYTFLTDAPNPRNGDVCKIIARVEAPDVLDAGPAFRVRFGDGEEDVAYAYELRPWFPT
jgi:hypothetical protein